MNPRLPSSKKWTQFPKDFAEQLESLFRENFSEGLKDKKMIIEGRIYPEEIVLRVGFLEAGQLRQNNFEASIAYSTAETQDAIDKIHNCVDAVATMMTEWFETDGEAELPLSWVEYPLKSGKIFLQYTSENTELEAMANALLGDMDLGLYNEEEESEDALARAEISDELSGAHEILSEEVPLHPDMRMDHEDLSNVVKH